jgi:hypothetical protein
MLQPRLRTPPEAPRRQTAIGRDLCDKLKIAKLDLARCEGADKERPRVEADHRVRGAHHELPGRVAHFQPGRPYGRHRALELDRGVGQRHAPARSDPIGQRAGDALGIILEADRSRDEPEVTREGDEQDAEGDPELRIEGTADDPPPAPVASPRLRSSGRAASSILEQRYSPGQRSVIRLTPYDGLQTLGFGAKPPERENTSETKVLGRKEGDGCS